MIDAALTLVDADPVVGPILRASGLRGRLELVDLPLTVDLAAAGNGHCLEWAFDQGPSSEGPRLAMEMSGATANRLLQGIESCAVGAARGEIKITGPGSAALMAMPALRHIARRYGEVISESYPHLLVSR